MSFSLYWRPFPKNRPEAHEGYDLKWVIAERFGEHDGSCREGPFVFDRSVIPWLEGVRDGHTHRDKRADIAKEADKLIKCIEANPQGVEVWIGDQDDN